LIQIVAINAGTLRELRFPHVNRPRVNSRKAIAAHEKGGVRITEAAFEAGSTGVLASSRFTAR
jgi:hypothetical protein